LITLTTDFGWRDPYVAAMKGVIYAANRQLVVVDLSHEIPALDILEGALFLASAVPYFPPGTIHVAVIDPGVGMDRHPIAVSAGGQILVCPDNGLPTLFLREYPLQEARIISNAVFMRETISATFHGRDIFAPAAARLASGAPLSELGEELDAIVTLDMPQASRDSAGAIQGEIIHVDRFGNLMSNIHHRILGGKIPRMVHAGGLCLEAIRRTYADAPPKATLALFGSSGYIEIAVNGGNAHETLGIEKGDAVEVVMGE
jgi:S-adenosylmethionine hydrolase